MFTEVQIVIARFRAELERLRHDEGGYSTEAVVTTALMVAIAIAAFALLGPKIIQWVQGIQM